MSQLKSTSLDKSEIDLARQILKELHKQLDTAAAGLDAGGADAARGVGRLMGLAYLKDRSVDGYREAVRLDPSSSRSRAMLVLALMKAAAQKEALEEARILAKQDPMFTIETLLPGESVSALALLGDAQAQAGQLDAAEKTYRSALEKAPTDAYVSGRLSELLLRPGRHSADAVKEAQRLVRNTGESARFSEVRAVIRAGVANALDLVQPVPGRPFVVNGERRRATVETFTGWETPLSPELTGLDAEQRAQLGEHWAVMGREEHAGVGSFARFVLQLMALGSPADLVQEATRAMNDEIEHAQLCFGIASAALGRSVGVGALDIENCLDGSSDPWTVLHATLVEGCVGETASAAIAAEARRRCTNEVIARVLDKIITDESRHADLAWKFCAWMLDAHPELAGQAAEAFGQAEQESVSAAPAADEGWDAALDGFGAVSPTVAERQARSAFLTEVLPRCEALLAGRAVAPLGLATV